MNFFSELYKGSFMLKLLAAIMAILFSIDIEAQVSKDSELYKTLKAYDNILFEEVFNQCKIEKMEPLIHEDLEFYHDVAGLENREQFFKSVKQNICSNSKTKPIRKLVQGTLEVFALKKNGKLYAAIQRGKHEFFLKENEKIKPTGDALFTHIWVLENNVWKLKRVLSYDHQPIKN